MEEKLENLTDIAIKAMDERRDGMVKNCRCEAIGKKLRRIAFMAIADEEEISDQTAKKRFDIDNNSGFYHFCCVQCCDCQYEKMIENFEIYEKGD